MTSKLDIARAIADRYFPVPEEAIALLESIIEYRELNKGEVLLREGQTAKDMIFVHSGMIRQFYYKNGRDITEHFTTEGYLAYCIISLFAAEPTELMIKALEPTIIYSIEYSRLEQLANQSLHINKLLRRILEWSLIVSQKKADSWRFETARERYIRFVREYPEAAKRASVNHIASYLLMTPESLSRVRGGNL